MKQNIQKYFGDRLFILQFDYCEKCKYFNNCYERTGRPDLISEECIDENWISENIKDCKDKNTYNVLCQSCDGINKKCSI